MVSIASSSNISISGGTFTINQINQTFSNAFEKLSRVVAHSALHDGPARSETTRCYQGTRTDVLNSVEKWHGGLEGILEASPSVLWLYGGAGAGKSAIMQTLSERWIPQGRAAGAFFFSRTDETRNTAKALVPTLAYQLERLHPTAMDILGPIIDSDPIVLKKSIETQTLHLLVRPLQELIRTGSICIRSEKVFLIDGLDECVDPAEQQAVIKSIRAVLYDHGVPVKFLVSSRPEQTISSAFDIDKGQYYALKTISLSNHEGAECDIQHFIVSEFIKICASHPYKSLIPSNWPPRTAITTMVRKSSSHFIYAATAMKYIASLEENPVRSLDVVLGLQVARNGTFNRSPFPDLDTLYSYILEKASHRDRVLQILAHCIFSTLPPLIDMICLLIDCSRDDIPIFLGDVNALVSIRRSHESGGILGNETKVNLLHASLGDFLRDKSRSGMLYIDEKAYHAGKLRQNLALLDHISRRKRIKVQWPISNDRAYDYTSLGREIFTSILKSADMPVTQEFVKSFGLQEFHRIQDRFNYEEEEFPPVFKGLFVYVDVIKSANFDDAGRLYRVFLEDFFDIFESYLRNEVKPLAPAILPLIFLGFSTKIIRDIIYHFDSEEVIWYVQGTISQWMMQDSFDPGLNPFHTSLVSVFNKLDASDLRVIRQCANASPENVAIAAETLLDYIFSKSHTPKKLPMRTPHRRWIQREKPGIRVATGSPKIASAFHLKFIKYKLNDALFPKDHAVSGKKTTYLGMIPKTGRESPNPETLYFLLLDAVLWLLPEAGFSEKLLRYASRVLPKASYQRFPKLARRLQRCFDAYSARVRDLKLRELSQEIECGSPVALMERVHFFALDLLD
ncbi:hypothetical protein D9619_011012 [Psilocybe cf. subviscida]|uniref:NACHT domain-containing protein n=1 Tax=Psilocybe cf. subviscida TaxID=2480587 RepID=A0A8H5EZU5_9AGAR|nr:hypothetical protein D9619_011012 [Psilocybe cf. subviscida]